MSGGKLTKVVEKEVTILPKKKHRMKDYKTLYKAKGGSKAYKSHVNPLMKMFPPSKYIKLTHHSLVTLTQNATSGNFGAVETYNLNSIYQPRGVTNTTNRVQGFDQLEAIYGTYKVYGCKVTIQFTNPTIDGMFAGVRVLSSNDGDTLLGERVSTASMKKWTWTKPINNTGSQVCTYKRYWHIGRIEGLNKTQLVADKDDYSAIMSSDPSNIPTMLIAAAGSTNSSDTMAALVHLEYYVQLFNRVDITTSVA